MFEKSTNFEGWNCGQITTCGDFGSICGGYKAKGRGDKIEKVFMVQGGHSYSVTMDVLKIDSWFAGWDLVHVFCISVVRGLEPVIMHGVLDPQQLSQSVPHSLQG